MNRYQYKPLGDGEIRLVSIAPGSGEDDVHCKLCTTSLGVIQKKEYMYAALSYHRGTSDAETEKNRIYIQDAMEIEDLSAQTNTIEALNKLVPPTNQEKEFFVHDNLNHALLQLRDPDNPVVLWVDAICIDQRDLPDSKKEKGKQVQMMAGIYKSAHSACIWLGLANTQTDLAMDLVRSIGKCDIDPEALVTDASYAPSWEALTYLMRLEWFRRRWTVHEVAFAQRATMHCGAKCIDWSDFTAAATLFSDELDEIRVICSDTAQLLSDDEAETTVSLVRLIGDLSCGSSVGLESLVSRLSRFHTDNPHDYIYSLMALSNDTARH